MTWRQEHSHRHEFELLALALLENINDNLVRLIEALIPQSVTATLTLEDEMPLTVGGTTTATLTFVDASGATATAPKGDGSGLVVAFTSSAPDIATVDAATLNSDGTYTATVTGVAVGSYSLGASVANSSGVALVDDDGTTAFVQPAEVGGEVTASEANQATTATITIA